MLFPRSEPSWGELAASPSPTGSTELIGSSVPNRCSHTAETCYLHGHSAYRGGSELKVYPVLDWLGFLCDSKVNLPNKLRSELKWGCGENCIQMLHEGLFLNNFLSLQSRPFTSPWKQLASADGCVWVDQWREDLKHYLWRGGSCVKQDSRMRCKC